MPKGTIYTSADRAISKYSTALKKGKGVKEAYDKADTEIRKKVPTGADTKRVIYENGKRQTIIGGKNRQALSNPNTPNQTFKRKGK